jgi:hypothetical protein
MKPYKNKVESSKLRLRRTFRISLLKLLRIKYSGYNIEDLLKKIETLDDFESLFSLLYKLIDIIPENSELIEQYSVQEEIDDIEESIIEAEENKETILEIEDNIIKISQEIQNLDGIFAEDDLEKLLDEDTVLI